LTVETKQQRQDAEHYPDKNASKIQTAISVLSDMETKLNELSGSISDMKRRLQTFAETESDKAMAEVVEQANKEAQSALEQVRQAAQREADAIVAKGMQETDELKTKISAKVLGAVDMIVKAVQTV
jgi:vacuolar-type H+-ATPase subunit H